MRHVPPALCLLAGLLGLATRVPGGEAETLRQKPITAVGGKAGDLLRQWWKEGTAAGNVGDTYDNRDGDHSPLNLAQFPQLRGIKYSPQDVKMGKHWAAQRVLLPGVVFGNSSTSAPPHLGGSNPRQYYSVPQGLHFLAKQYEGNNLYIYPEHRDHDPGRNGKDDAYGDLYPTNTPYLLISQGSSGSDQPFMRAVPLTLAAFRPEVKRKLTEAGLLMPAVQMILRSTNKHLKDPKEYLTGKAHPTAFEGAWVDDVAMVRLAHEMDLTALPPLVRLKVVEEDRPAPGVDYFEPGAVTETLADTPAVIARVFRGKDRTRRLVVSAEGSYDLNKAPLRYTWVVLRGDPDRITITLKNKDQSVAEIVVPHPERRPVAPGSPLESNRIDIGVFAYNGTYPSAPAFVTFFGLDRESRTYDRQGKPLEIAHGLGETRFNVTDWPTLLDRLGTDGRTGEALRLTEAQRTLCAEAAAELKRRYAARTEAEAAEKVAAEAAKEADVRAARAQRLRELIGEEEVKGAMGIREGARKETEAARKRLSEAQRAADDVLRQRRDPLSGSLRDFVDARLRAAVAEPELRARHWAATRKDALKPYLPRLQRWGIAAEDGALRPLRPGKTPADADWTPFEKAQLDFLHAQLLTRDLFDGLLQVNYQTNYVDPRLSTPREWRDVYRYDASGALLGWTRHGPAGSSEFNHEGLLVVVKDGRGRVTKARPVRYVAEATGSAAPNVSRLRAEPAGAVVRYAFDGDDDLRGRRQPD